MVKIFGAVPESLVYIRNGADVEYLDKFMKKHGINIKGRVRKPKKKK